MLSWCTSLNIFNLDINNPFIENISYLFYYCQNLEEINIININTSNVISNIFSNCDNIINLFF